MTSGETSAKQTQNASAIFAREQQPTLSVLLLDDSTSQAELISQQLSQTDANIGLVSVTQVEAMADALQSRYDVLLLNLQLGDVDGLELIKENFAGLPSLPIILLTDDDHPNTQARALRMGVADCLRKSELNPTVLSKAIRYSYNLFKQYRLNEQMTALERALAVDPTTGLNSVAYCKHQIEHWHQQNPNSAFALLACQMHNISAISHSLGTDKEAQLMQRYNHWLIQRLPSNRVTGCSKDLQILLLIPNITLEQTHSLCQQLGAQSITLEPDDDLPELQVTHSVGAAHYHPSEACLAYELIEKASAAQKAIRGGKNYRIHNHTLAERLKQRAVVARDITKAIAEEQIYFDIQPQFSVNDAKLSGGEVLMRWQHPELGLIDPEIIVEVAAATQQMGRLGTHALNTTLTSINHWLANGWINPQQRIAVNLSAAELETPGYIDQLSRTLIRHPKACQHLELEITESIQFQNLPAIGSDIERLKKFGVTIALDDFGTRHANLEQLCWLNVNTVKLDKSIIRTAENQQRARTIYHAIRKMLYELNVNIIAEGIETNGQLEMAQQMGVNAVQGYLLSKAVSTDEFAKLLQQRLLSDSSPIVDPIKDPASA